MSNVRHVTHDDIEAIASWAIPRFQDRHPRITIEGMMPLLKLALDNPINCYLVHTDNACGLFMVEGAPWEPLPVVTDVFVVGREGYASAPFEALQIYAAAIEWARSIGAVEFRYGVDTDMDMSAIAKRLGYDRVAINYVKKLREV